MKDCTQQNSISTMNFQFVLSLIAVSAFGSLFTNADDTIVSVTVDLCARDPCFLYDQPYPTDCNKEDAIIQIIDSIVAVDSWCGVEWDKWCVASYNYCGEAPRCADQENVEIITEGVDIEGTTLSECPALPRTPQPTPLPTATPTSRPLPRSTFAPTRSPTRNPTPDPTPVPTPNPTPDPTAAPVPVVVRSTPAPFTDAPVLRSTPAPVPPVGTRTTPAPTTSKSKEGTKSGSKDGSKSGSKLGGKFGSKDGTKLGKGKSGTKLGSKGGILGKSKDGSKDGAKIGGKIGSKNGVKSGSKSGTKLGTKLGSKGGVKSGSKSGTKLGSKNGTKSGRGKVGSKIASKIVSKGKAGSKSKDGNGGASAANSYVVKTSGVVYSKTSLEVSQNPWSDEVGKVATLSDNALLGFNQASSATSHFSVFVLSLATAAGVAMLSLF